jgi:endonuclease G
MRPSTIAIAIAIAIVVGVAISTDASAESTSCPEHFLGGQAPDLVQANLAKKAQPLCYREFGLLYSGLTRTPLWSADHLTADRVAQAHRQHRKDALDTFHEEVSLPPENRATLQDYVRSGYDRGHMSPNGDMDSPEAQGESFTLANMVPQNPQNNRGIWSDVEGATRAMARHYGEIFVVTMPVFAGAQTLWLHNRVAIPSKIAKAVYIPALNAASAYVTENGPSREWQAISIAQLRNLTGIDPFPALQEQVKQTAIELLEPVGHGTHRPDRVEAPSNETRAPVGPGTVYHLLRTFMR